MYHTGCKRDPGTIQRTVQRDAASAAADDKDFRLTADSDWFRGTEERIIGAALYCKDFRNPFTLKNLFRCAGFNCMMSVDSQNQIRKLLRKVKLME